MGEFKPLLDLNGMAALERAVNLFRSAGVEDVRVVTGHRAAELAPLLERLAVREVPNFVFSLMGIWGAIAFVALFRRR
jgi:molybdenum cofactor cytidylyltransferase